MDKVFDHTSYTCIDFTYELWLKEYNIDLKSMIHGFITGAALNRRMLRMFKHISKPVDPCLAVFQPTRGSSHIGTYVRGRIIHITRSGVQFQPIETILPQFKSVKFYSCHA